MALAGMLTFVAPPKADARIRFGVAIGGPVYTAPVPVYPYGYQYPYPAYGPNYYAAPVYPYPYPGRAYVAPYGGFSVGIGGGHRDYGRRPVERFDRGRRR
jgi:hypothetical protein